MPELNPARRQEIVTQTARVASIKDVRGKRQQKGRHLYAGELKALLRARTDDPRPTGVRDAAMIAKAWVTSARRAEIVNLDLSDYTPTGENEVDLMVRGKGDNIEVNLLC